MAYCPADIVSYSSLPNLVAAWIRKVSPHVKITYRDASVSDPMATQAILTGCTACGAVEKYSLTLIESCHPLDKLWLFARRHCHRREEDDFGHAGAWLAGLQEEKARA
jgi:hypothetical protein